MRERRTLDPSFFDRLAPALALFAVVGCATAPVAQPGTTELDRLYEAAIRRSAIYRAEDQSTDLRAVTGPAVMASFLSCCGCDRESPEDCQGARCSSKCYREPGRHTLTADLWVSFADQLQASCRRFPPGEGTILGIQQLQGLPPRLRQPIDTWKVVVVKITGPEELFRPCANPDPTSTGPCTEVFPCSWQSDESCSADRQTAIEAHRSWIAGQAFDSWQLPDGYPWTRQGYTYNWNPKAASIVGSSEFVVREGSEVEVLALVPADEFCHSFDIAALPSRGAAFGQ